MPNSDKFPSKKFPYSESVGADEHSGFSGAFRTPAEQQEFEYIIGNDPSVGQLHGGSAVFEAQIKEYERLIKKPFAAGMDDYLKSISFFLLLVGALAFSIYLVSISNFYSGYATSFGGSPVENVQGVPLANKPCGPLPDSLDNESHRNKNIEITDSGIKREETKNNLIAQGPVPDPERRNIENYSALPDNVPAGDAQEKEVFVDGSSKTALEIKNKLIEYFIARKQSSRVPVPDGGVPVDSTTALCNFLDQTYGGDHSRLIVLSACQTGLGVKRGDGVIFMTNLLHLSRHGKPTEERDSTAGSDNIIVRNFISDHNETITLYYKIGSFGKWRKIASPISVVVADDSGNIELKTVCRARPDLEKLPVQVDLKIISDFTGR